MNIDDVYKEIEILENSAFTSENTRDLASLYIIKAEYEKLKYEPANAHISKDNVVQELNDIFPSYKKYVECKTEYQLGKANDDLLIDTFSLLCQEVGEFLNILYCTTDKVKERKVFRAMIEKFFKKL